MKRTLILFVLPLVFFAASPTSFAYYPDTHQHFANRSADSHNSDQIEGWIVKMDIQKSRIFVMDVHGVQKQLTLKPGIISDFRIKDKVRVKAWPGSRDVNTIEKIKS